MPRVSEQYRASRRAEIITSAAGLFAKDGFHATSMADIIRDSGLSAGAVYRYFRSKEEIIGAVADSVLETADQIFGDMLADGAVPSPAAAVTQMVNGIVGRAMDTLAGGHDLTRVAVQVWSEALRDRNIHERADRAYRRLRDHCTEVARRWQNAGNLPADVDPGDVGTAMLGLAQGFVLQHLLIDGTTAAGYLAGVDALFSARPRTVDET